MVGRGWSWQEGWGGLQMRALNFREGKGEAGHTAALGKPTILLCSLALT